METVEAHLLCILVQCLVETFVISDSTSLILPVDIDTIHTEIHQHVNQRLNIHIVIVCQLWIACCCPCISNPVVVCPGRRSAIEEDGSTQDVTSVLVCGIRPRTGNLCYAVVPAAPQGCIVPEREHVVVPHTCRIAGVATRSAAHRQVHPYTAVSVSVLDKTSFLIKNVTTLYV